MMKASSASSARLSSFSWSPAGAATTWMGQIVVVLSLFAIALIWEYGATNPHVLQEEEGLDRRQRQRQHQQLEDQVPNATATMIIRNASFIRTAPIPTPTLTTATTTTATATATATAMSRENSMSTTVIFNTTLSRDPIVAAMTSTAATSSSSSLSSFSWMGDTRRSIVYNNPARTASSVAIQVRYDSNRAVHNLAGQFFGGGTCAYIKQQINVTSTDRMPPAVLLNVSFHCHDLFQKDDLGTGNYISAFFGLRLVADALSRVNHTAVDVLLDCVDAIDQANDLILPWMMGYFPSPIQYINQPHPTLQDACADYKRIPIAYKAAEMQWELRRMAIAMVGIPSTNHPAAAFAQQYLGWPTNRPEGTTKQSISNTVTTAFSAFKHDPNVVMRIPHPTSTDPPIYPHVELDQAVFHFRCGDLIFTNHPSFGFMKFGSFSRHLHGRNVTSIGIATQPFSSDGQQRGAEGGSLRRQRCQIVVNRFVKFLQNEFPMARITIRNDEHETISLTFARMVMADYVVVAISSFGVFPAVATFGQGYIRKPDYVKAPNRWLLEPNIETILSNVHLIEEPKLMAYRCKKMWGTDGKAVLDWFENYNLP